MDLNIKRRIKSISKLDFWIVVISILLFISAFFIFFDLGNSRNVWIIIGYVLFYVPYGEYLTSVAVVLLTLCGVGLMLSFKIARETAMVLYILNIIGILVSITHYFPRGILYQVLGIVTSSIILWYIERPSVKKKFY